MTDIEKLIAVPVAELEKLEQARKDLYDYLTPLLSRHDLVNLINITSQIWRVANTKCWVTPDPITQRNYVIEDACCEIDDIPGLVLENGEVIVLKTQVREALRGMKT